MKNLLKSIVFRLYAPLLRELGEIRSSQNRDSEKLSTYIFKLDEMFARLGGNEHEISRISKTLESISNSEKVLLEEKKLLEEKALLEEKKLLEENNFLRKNRDVFTTIKLMREYIQQGHFPNYEDYLEQIYSKLIDRGDGVIDIGCHAGRHLSRFLDLINPGGKALAFEPLPRLAETLKHKFPQENVTIINKALSNVSGVAPFFDVENYQEESGLRKRLYNREDASPQQITVEVDVLDNYIDAIGSIKFIKIDTEGAEIDILHGGKALINKYRPLISVEYGFPGYSVFGYTKQNLWDFAKEMNYDITDIFGNVMLTRDVWETACDSVYWDYILVPEEKIKWFFERIHG